MNLFLIGFMGCGKSTIGKALALSNKMSLIDLDSYIEECEGQSIASLFSNFGESAFRDIERKHLTSIVKMQNQVIALGGGAPCFFDNMELMNQHGVTIYLQMSAGALLERLWSLPPAARAARPLLAGKTKEELGILIVQMLQKRNPFYSKARIVVDNEVNDWTIVIERINMALKHM